jgi:hypothetical protein
VPSFPLPTDFRKKNTTSFFIGLISDPVSQVRTKGKRKLPAININTGAFISDPDPGYRSLVLGTLYYNTGTGSTKQASSSVSVFFLQGTNARKKLLQ